MGTMWPGSHLPLLLLLALSRVGCDGVVGSGRLLDACGECGGNNSTCQIISGIFTEPYMEAGYRLVAQIPAGACSVRIEEIGHTKNYLALRDSNGQFIINGDWNIDLPGKYDGAGASFSYHRRSGAGETITTQGPIAEPVDLFLLYRQANRGIKYEFAIKRNSSLTSVLPRLPMLTGPSQGGAEPPPASLRRQGAHSQADQPRQRDAPASDGAFVSPLYQPGGGGERAAPFASGSGLSSPKRRRRRRRRRRHRFQWVVTGYTDCSKSCGGGIQTTEVVCMKRKRKQLAPDRHCNPAQRPPPSTARCNTRPCPASWEPGVWSVCSVTCGSGQQQRPYLCQSEGSTVAVSQCPGPAPQADSQPCRLPDCPQNIESARFTPPAPANTTDASWSIGSWSSCSVSCGWGSRRRLVTCPAGVGRCPEAARPRQVAPCRRPGCADAELPAADAQAAADDGWMVTEWAEECSVDCGRGLQWRQVTCLGSCSEADRPAETRPCKTDRRCGGTWFAGPWSRCSHECGWGVQRRAVLCVSYSSAAYTVVADAACGADARPAEEQSCGGPRSECAARWHVSDWGSCAGDCGAARQSRAVACLSAFGTARTECPTEARPDGGRSCLSPACGKSVAPPGSTVNGTLQLYRNGADSITAPSDNSHDNFSFDGLPSDGASESPPTTTTGLYSEEVRNSITVDQPSDTSTNLVPSPGSDQLTSLPAADAPTGHRHRPGGRRHRQKKLRKHRHRPAADQRQSPDSGGPRSDECLDQYHNCPLVQQARLCKYKYYRTVCCKTCSREKH